MLVDTSNEFPQDQQPSEQPQISAYLPGYWQQEQTRNLALGMIDRFVKRDELFGPERTVGVSLRERDALLHILSACKWTMLSRKPDADHPNRKHAILAFRSGKHANLHDEMLVSPSGSDLDYILVPADRKKKHLKDADDLENDGGKSNSGDAFHAFRKHHSDRLYVSLEETGHRINLPLTAQKVKKLKRIRNDLREAAESVLQRRSFSYGMTDDYQRRIQRLADSFDTLIEGIKKRAEAPKRHKSQNKMSGARRHSNFLNACDEVAESTEVALRLDLAHRNRITAEQSRQRKSEPNKRPRGQARMVGHNVGAPRAS